MTTSDDVQSMLSSWSEGASPMLELETPCATGFRPLDDGPAVPELFQAAPAPPLRIGLLNNMPDSALERTEWQFRALIGADVDVRLFAFRDIRRGPAAEAYLDTNYASHEALAAAGLDALIVTGSEPRLARLEDEPYYAALGSVVDWAAANTVSTLFSCLAAHAAVLHLDGIRRRPLAAKCSGVFPCTTRSAHRLLRGLPETVDVPHSRWNGLSEADLVAHGYEVLLHSEEIGVDLFVRDGESLFVFLQGHPEYEPDSLAREYRRDLLRFLGGSNAICPSVPANYFAEETAAALRDIAGGTSPDPDPLAITPDLLALRPSTWSTGAARLFRNWLSCVAMRRRELHGAVAR